ncbi:MAG: hypothetical protein IFK92_14385 [Acidobacteria bacterium]|nr:hypothetical protein [Candidatus Sulfomarinibacter kjeldsenii]
MAAEIFTDAWAQLWNDSINAKGAIAASENELEDTPYVIKAEPAAWKSVLGGKTDPIVGLMGGKLKLAKGSLFALLPYAKAAKELVKSAIDVDTSYPDGW